MIVVGNSASGIDIGQQIAEVCAPPLLISRRSAGYFGPSPAGARVREVAAIQAVNCAGGGGTVQFVDGQSEAGVDAILFCTGYLYAYPFLAAAFPQHAGLAVVHDGSRVQHTYEHLLFASHPSLAFLALPHKVVPFQLAQAQAAVLARLYAGRLPLPAREAMRSWESDTLRQRGPARAFHMLAYPLDADYMRMLADWAATADDRTDPLGRLVGMPPPRWGPWECWARERFTLMRQAFRELGPARAGVRTLDDLGFVFRL